jgi:hypothetical protein
MGVAGATLSCEESNAPLAQCAFSQAAQMCVPVNYTEVPLKGGEAGGTGGPGGKGGTSGGGSGGPSVAIAYSSSVTLNVDASTLLTPGFGGKGGGAAPMGMSVAKLKF